MRVEEVMSTDVQTIDVAASADAAWNQMKVERIHHLVVLREHMVVGIISDRDLGGPHGVALRQGRTVADLMTSYAVSANRHTTVRQAANLMRGRAIGSLPVLDRGRLVGIITVSDLLELIGKGLERPIAQATRRTLRRRAPRRKPIAALR
jgi:acetoin utilization protein AcuB